MSTLPNPAFTRAEDVTVLDVHTPSFTGALAVVGIQACFGSGHEVEVVPGVRLFDVTHPEHPTLLGHWDLPQGTIGCHEIDAVQRADGTALVSCARNLVDHQRSNGANALHLIDATNPASPQAITDWSLNVDPDAGVGCLANSFAHSARFDDGGMSIYVSYWDAGTVHLDITTPTSPKVVSDTKITPPDEDGDNHSMTLANDGKILVINTEDFSPGDCPNNHGVRRLGRGPHLRQHQSHRSGVSGHVLHPEQPLNANPGLLHRPQHRSHRAQPVLLLLVVRRHRLVDARRPRRHPATRPVRPTATPRRLPRLGVGRVH